MVGVASYVDKRGPLPTALKKVFEWRHWNVLPRDGGARDQAAADLAEMRLAGAVFDAWYIFRRRPPGWHKAPSWVWRIVRNLRERYKYGH